MDVEGDLLDTALLQPREVQDADMKSPNKSATAEVQLVNSHVFVERRALRVGNPLVV